MLLSVDWDAYSGTRELVFDAPIWGTPDREHDRLAAWQARARKRGGWAALEADYPLDPAFEALAQYAGRPCFVTLSHADAWPWLERFPGRDVLNLDSHHDLVSFSGDGTRLRPGNWAGLGLRAGLIRQYTVQYPEWHAGLPVAEGFDLPRTQAEVAPLLPPGVRARVHWRRDGPLPPPEKVESVLLVQSPAWTSPTHDGAFLSLAARLACQVLHPPLDRRNSSC